MPTVLVVDDELSARKLLARLLQAEGYTVLVAADAYEAMTAAKKNRPDLILLDVMIPPMDGLTFLLLLRQEGLGYDVPVIVLTGLSDEQTVARARELGVKDVLVKSTYTPDELLAKVATHIRKPEVE